MEIITSSKNAKILPPYKFRPQSLQNYRLWKSFLSAIGKREKKLFHLVSLCVSDDWVFVSNVFLERMGWLSTPRSFRQNVPFIIYPSWCVCVRASLIKYVMSFHPSKKRRHLWLLWTNFYRQSRTNRGVVWLLLNRNIPKTRKFSVRLAHLLNGK